MSRLNFHGWCVNQQLQRFWLAAFLVWLMLALPLSAAARSIPGQAASPPAAATSASARTSDPWAPFDHPWFNRIGIADGLPHSVTTALAQDSRGLVWIGTMRGLVRYDGYRMQVFGDRGDGAPGLPDPYVRSLLALPGGGLLVGTNAGGLVRFDPASGAFRDYPIGSGGTADRKIHALAMDHHGGAWIASDRGLDHLDLASNRITRVDTGGAASARNFSVFEDRTGTLWLGNDRGLFVRHAGSKAFVRPVNFADAAGVVLANQIWAISEDREGRLWVGSGQAGAAYRDRDGRWTGVPGFSGYLEGGQQSTVRALLEIRPNTMWMATDGDGVVSYTPGDVATTHLHQDLAVPSSLPGNNVRALLQDHSDNIWAATDLGVGRTDPRKHTAFALLASPLRSDMLSDPSVRALFVDSNQRIWVGLSSGHLDMIDLQAGTIRHLSMRGNQSRRDVQAFAQTDDGTLWIGTQGLARLDPDTLTIQPDVLPTLWNTPILSLSREDAAHILIGTYDGVYRYNIHTRALTHFGHSRNDSGSLAANTVRVITAIGSGFWFGTTRGISIGTGPGQSDHFTRLVHRSGEPTSLPQNLITAITPGALGRLWVSTFGGVAVTDPRRGTSGYAFTTIAKTQGLSDENINASLADDHGNLWVSMSNGIAMINGRTLQPHNLSARDGVHVASYIDQAAARAPDGSLLFGGQGGITVIDPRLSPPRSVAKMLSVTGATYNGIAAPFGALPLNGGMIDLASRSRSLRVDFSLLDYRAPSETSYSYRMDGFEQDWTEIPRGSLPSAIYTNLPNGQYRLRLRAKIPGMRPQTVETDVNIQVQPRWYETTLTQIVGVLLLLLAIACLIHLRTVYLRRNALQLQREIDEHTRELRAANLRLDELAGTDELTGAYNRRRFLALARGERERVRDRTCCLAVLDLDNFKHVNDSFGHLAGDAVLRATVEVIRRHCRADDLIGRYGGEEFVICLPDTTLDIALERAQSIRAAIARNVVEYQDQPIRVTTSIGVAELGPGESLEQWLSRADAALYAAKRSGRDCCMTAA